MTTLLRALRPTLLPLVFGLPLTVQAADDIPREDRHYVGLLATALNHRSVGDGPEKKTWSNAATLVVGGHLTELFHAELRLGGGLSEGTLDDELSLDIEHYQSWYMGLHHPLTDYANIYGQFGFTHVSGSASLTKAGKAREDDPDDSSPYADQTGDFPDSDFSVSWIVGADLELAERTYLLVEGGRLFKDTGTGANSFQFSAGLRYEF